MNLIIWLVYTLFKLWLCYCFLCGFIGCAYGLYGSLTQLKSEQYKNDTTKTTIQNYFTGMFTGAVGIILVGHVVPAMYIYFLVMSKKEKKN